MPTQPFMKLQQLADGVKARISKEIAREGADTEMIGGLTKLGNETERMLKCVAEIICNDCNVDLASEIAGRSAGSGTYAKIIRDRGRSRPLKGDNSLLARIIKDLRMPRDQSALGRLIDLRNSNNHPSTQPVDRPRVIDILQAVGRLFAGG